MFKLVSILFLFFQLAILNAEENITTLQVLDDNSIVSGVAATDGPKAIYISPNHKSIKEIIISENGEPELNDENSNFNRIYVNTNNIDEMYSTISGIGSGLYKSSDFGKNWLQYPVKNQYNYESDWYTNLYIDPFNFNRFFVIKLDGKVLRTDDGGVSFKSITRSLDGYFFSTKTNNLHINPKESNKILISSDYGIYKSIDYGETWLQISDRADIIQVLQDSHDENTIYVLTNGFKIEKSVDGGKSFTPLARNLYFGIKQNTSTGDLFAYSCSLYKNGGLYGLGLSQINRKDNIADKIIPVFKNKYVLNVSFNDNYPNLIYVANLDNIKIIDINTKEVVETIYFENNIIKNNRANLIKKIQSKLSIFKNKLN